MNRRWTFQSSNPEQHIEVSVSVTFKWKRPWPWIAIWIPCQSLSRSTSRFVLVRSKEFLNLLRVQMQMFQTVSRKWCRDAHEANNKFFGLLVSLFSFSEHGRIMLIGCSIRGCWIEIIAFAIEYSQHSGWDSSRRPVAGHVSALWGYFSKIDRWWRQM